MLHTVYEYALGVFNATDSYEYELGVFNASWAIFWANFPRIEHDYMILNTT